MRVRNKERKRIPVRTAIDMKFGEVRGGGGIIKVKENHPITEELRPSKVEIDCCFFRKDQSKFVRDIYTSYLVSHESSVVKDLYVTLR